MSGTLDLALRNLAAWCVQGTVLWLTAMALARLLPIERPGVRLAFYQALLLLVLGLPLLQPWQAAEAPAIWTAWHSPAAVAPTADAGGAPASPWHPGWPIVVTALLGLGVAVRLAKLAAGLAALRSLRRHARPLAASPWMLELRDQLVPRARFLASDAAGTPATFGLRRPTILLPSAFISMERERQAAVVLHELLHARRADWLALMLEELATAAFFFHPAVHGLVGRVRIAREQTVDAAVVRRLGGREAYLESLVEVARLANHPRAVPAAPFLRENHLRERVDLLLREVPMTRLRAFAYLAITASAIILAVSWTASALPLQSSKPPLAPSTPAAASSEDTAVTQPKLIHEVRPTYPPDAKAEGVQGLVLVEFTIDKDGVVRDPHVASAAVQEKAARSADALGASVATTTDTRLQAAALEAIKQWRFEPARKNGQPVESVATAPVSFVIQ